MKFSRAEARPENFRTYPYNNNNNNNVQYVDFGIIEYQFVVKNLYSKMSKPTYTAQHPISIKMVKMLRIKQDMHGSERFASDHISPI